MQADDTSQTYGPCTRPFERTTAFDHALIAALSDFNSDYVTGTDFRTLFDKLLSNFLSLTESEYGFIGEILKDQGTPYLRTHAITNIAWDRETQLFYQANAEKGFEFRNLNTLFGRVISSGRQVISNDPAIDTRAGGLPPNHPALRSFFGIPLFVGGNFIGMLGIANRPGGYDATLAQHLRPLMHFTAAMIEAARINQLRATQAQLVHTEKMAAIGTLTAGVAHEINNPANFVRAGAQTLATGLEQFRAFLLELAGEDAEPQILDRLNGQIDALAAQVATIVEGAGRITGLVRDLRTFSRLDEAESKAVAIGDSLLATINLVSTQYVHEVRFVNELTANPVLECHPAQLNQVFMNLIVNACHAIGMKRRGDPDAPAGTLTIRSRIDNAYLVLEFEDDGCGIPSSVIDRIYDPFFTTKGVGDGSGLGLSISYGIIEKHRGTLSVRSVENEGTVFTVRLPLGADG